MLEWLLLKRQKIEMLARMRRKGVPGVLLMGRYTGSATTEDSTEFLHKVKTRNNLWSSNPTSGYKSKRNKIMIPKRYLHYHVHCSIIRNSQDMKRPKCSSMDEQMKKIRYIYTMEYYSAKRKNEILSFVTTWMDLEDIILREISQKEEDQYCIYH